MQILDEKNTESTESFSTLATPSIIANSPTPVSHRRVADNYIVIKRLYKTQSVKSGLLNSEKELLNKYNLKPLAELSIQEENKEIMKLKMASFSEDEQLASDADLIIQIRAKELRFILSSRYATYFSEINDGYRALERYFEEVTKFYRLPY